jgi:hypothetical protein
MRKKVTNIVAKLEKKGKLEQKSLAFDLHAIM